MYLLTGINPSTGAPVAVQSSEIAATVLPVNAQIGTAYILQLTDAPAPQGKGIVTMNNAAANVVTIPENATVAFSIGTKIEVVQLGAGETTISGASGVTVNTPSTITATVQYQTLTLTQVATDIWIVS